MMISINVESKINEFQPYPTNTVEVYALCYLYVLSQSSSRPNEEMKSFSSWSHMSFEMITHYVHAT